MFFPFVVEIVWLILFVAKEFQVFLFKVWRKKVFAYEHPDFFGCKESAAIQFVGGDWRIVGYGFERINQFAVARTFKDVAAQELRFEIL